MRNLRWILFLSLISCHHRDKSMSFYYWRTMFFTDSLETKVLRDNAINTLYIRYFDVDWSGADSTPKPIAPIRFSTALPTSVHTVIPVVYFNNRVFERLDSTDLPTLTARVLSLVSYIDTSAGIRPPEIQFDCDWTERTRDNYFSFLRLYHELS